MIRTELQELKNIVEGQNVFIIGGGPSLKTFDFKLLEDKIVIAINNCAKHIKNITAVYWTDSDWASKNLDKLNNLNCLKFTAKKNAQGYIKGNLKALGGATVLNKLNDYGYTTDIDTVCGNNSGAQVLNLICNMKPYKVILLGYDMGFVDGESHWHEGYEISSPTVYSELFIPSINSMAENIKKLGIDIINCNERSNLTCFKKDKIQNYL